MGSGKKVGIALGVSVGLLSLLLLVILLPLSFVVLQNDEIGLVYHNYTMVLETEMYGEGRHYIGDPACLLTVFKRTFVQLVFNDNLNASAYSNLATSTLGGTVRCESSDGIEVDIESSLQYKLASYDANGDVITVGKFTATSSATAGYVNYSTYGSDDSLLYLLFHEFGTGYEEIIINQCRQAIFNTCGQYDVQTFYYSRGQVESAMAAAVSQSVDELGLGVTTSLFQLINVGLPTGYSDAVSEKEQARTDISTAQNERIQALIQSNTAVQQAQLKADLSVYVATQTAAATVISAYTTGNVSVISYSASATSYSAYGQGFSWGANELLRYIAIDGLTNAASLTVGVVPPAQYGKTNCTGVGC